MPSNFTFIATGSPIKTFSPVNIPPEEVNKIKHLFEDSELTPTPYNPKVAVLSSQSFEISMVRSSNKEEQKFDPVPETIGSIFEPGTCNKIGEGWEDLSRLVMEEKRTVDIEVCLPDAKKREQVWRYCNVFVRWGVTKDD